MLFAAVPFGALAVFAEEFGLSTKFVSPAFKLILGLLGVFNGSAAREEISGFGCSTCLGWYELKSMFSFDGLFAYWNPDRV